MKETASRLCSILADLFGEDLDRLTLWSRIDTALATAYEKSHDGDMDRYVTLCLDHIKADATRIAASEPLAQMLATFDSRPPEWRQRFARYINDHRATVGVRGRARWAEVKKGTVDL